MAKRPDPVEPRAPAKAAGAVDRSQTTTTAIHIPRDTHALLRAVAFVRAQKDGGRASVSALLVELVEQHRKELEAEASGPLYPKRK